MIERWQEFVSLFIALLGAITALLTAILQLVQFWRLPISEKEVEWWGQSLEALEDAIADQQQTIQLLSTRLEEKSQPNSNDIRIDVI